MMKGYCKDTEQAVVSLGMFAVNVCIEGANISLRGTTLA